MNIAVIDVAAENGGALSVLKDFLEYVVSVNDENKYYVFVSKEIDIIHPRIQYILKSEVKNSWLSRLKWEHFSAINELKALNIDVVFSLQNTAFFTRKLRQVVYFHNALLLEPRRKYSLFKKSERRYGIYTRFIGPYTFKSLKNATTIICQTETVKSAVEKRVSSAQVYAVNPNVFVDEPLINSANDTIRGYLYPAAAVPFKKIEDVIRCYKNHHSWFDQNGLELLITIDGTENDYAKSLANLSKDISGIRLIGYQQRRTILEKYKDYALIINSELESYPIPFIEAGLVGTSIVAADYPYAIEILKNNQNAAIYKKNDLSDMFEKMKYVYQNERDRKSVV